MRPAGPRFMSVLLGFFPDSSIRKRRMSPLAAIYRHARTRNAYERDLRHVIARFRRRPRRCPTAWSCSMPRTASTGRIRARVAQLGLDLAHDAAQPLVNLVRATRSSCATSRPAISPTRSSSRRVATPGARSRSRSCRSRVDEKLLMSRDVTRARGGRAHAPRLHRQRLARAQDAADRHQRIHRDAAGHRRSTSGSASASCS